MELFYGDVGGEVEQGMGFMSQRCQRGGTMS